MDAQNRLTKWEEWEVGAHYQWVKGGVALGTYDCVGLDRLNGFVMLKHALCSDTIRTYAWQRRYRKL